MISLLTLVITIYIPLIVTTTHQIISTTFNQNEGKNEYHANDNALNFLSTTQGPYKIISVIGQARKGKSTTLNRIASTLINHDVSPFKTSDDIDPCTQGIWMYIIPKCNKCISELDKCAQSANNEHCIDSKYSFIFLDIEGSDTAKNDVALRYASIATLLSSKIFLFIHETLYAHDIDHINDIEIFRKTMSKQNIDIPFDELDLGIIIREPLGEKIGGKLEEKINHLFREFSGINLNNNSELLLNTIPVFAVDSFDNAKNYKKSIANLAHFIRDETNYKSSRHKVKFGSLSADKIIEFIHYIIDAMNDNEDLNAICIGCLFTKIIDWNQWGEWSECTEKCGGGIQERQRTCNTGRDTDCTKFRHGSAVHQQTCNVFPCADLQWGEWHEWSKCDKKCGGGSQERYRECKTGNYRDCEKDGSTKSDYRKCNVFPCELLQWGEWHRWSECDKKCGGGTQERYRECKTGNDKDCQQEQGGTRWDERKCNTYSCRWVCVQLGYFC